MSVPFPFAPLEIKGWQFHFLPCQQLAEVLGSDRRAAVCREITKLHEETQRGTLAELSQHYTEKGVKGEIVIIVAGLEE